MWVFVFVIYLFLLFFLVDGFLFSFLCPWVYVEEGGGEGGHYFLINKDESPYFTAVSLE